MEKFMSYIIILAIIALIAFICYRIVKSEKTKEPIVGQTRSDDEDDDDDTLIPAEWQVAQLDPDSGSVIKSANVVVPNDGKFVIGRSKSSDFMLVNVSNDVSRAHLGVGRDREGYFAKPLKRDERIAVTYIDNKLISDSFSLVDGQVIWLSSVPIVFIHRSSAGRQLSFNINASAPMSHDGFVDVGPKNNLGRNTKFSR